MLFILKIIEDFIYMEVILLIYVFLFVLESGFLYYDSLKKFNFVIV